MIHAAHAYEALTILGDTRSTIPERVFNVEVCNRRPGRQSSRDLKGHPSLRCFQHDGHFRYAVDMEGYGALQFCHAENLVVHPN